MTVIARQPEGQPTGGQFARISHSDQVPALGGIPVAAADPAMDPAHPWRPYAITQDEDGELHYDDVTADWAMQHKEPVTRTEIRRALSCPRLAGRQGRVVDLSNPPGRRFSERDDDYDVVGPASGAPLVIRVRDGLHRLHIRSGNVQVEVQGGFGGGVTVYGGAEAGIIVDGTNKYSVDIEGSGRARIGLSEEARVNVRANGTGASYLTGGGEKCSVTAAAGAMIHQDGPEENRLPVRRPAASRTAKDLKPGDVFSYSHGDTVHAVEILRAPEPHIDVTGLHVLKMWCRTDGREGWMVLGPQALTPAPEAGEEIR
jgi:hypothetical protein